MSSITVVKEKDKSVPDFFLGTNPEVKESFWTTKVLSAGIDYTGEELFPTTAVSSNANQLSSYVVIIPSETREICDTRDVKSIFGCEEFEHWGVIGNEVTLLSPQISFKTEPIVILSNSIEFALSKNLDREIELIMDVICDCFDFNKFELELVSDYETDFQQICFSIQMKISYDDLANLRESFYQKLFQLNMPIEKEKYFVFDFEREEP